MDSARFDRHLGCEFYFNTELGIAIRSLTVCHFQGGRTLAEDVKVAKSPFIDRLSPYDPTNARANAEKELLDLHSPKEARNTVAILNLCGLYGGERSIRRYVGRIAGTKEMLRAKNSIHMIHGIDVARAIYATAKGPSHMMGERWLLTGKLTLRDSAILPFNSKRPHSQIYEYTIGMIWQANGVPQAKTEGESQWRALKPTGCLNSCKNKVSERYLALRNS
jgi:hypothetical protein